MTNSKKISVLLQNDSLTENTYSRNNFLPAQEASKFSYTSHRVTKPVYNTYKKSADADYKVFGYYTDWSQYDARLDNGDTANENIGRGVDITKVAPNAYDKIILGFLGVVGDQGEKSETIAKAASCDNWPISPADTMGFCLSQFHVTFTDPWGDVLSYRNCGFGGWLTNDVQSMYNQNKAHGVLGALRNMKQANPDLRIGVSIGGWTMSNIFYELSRDPAARKIFNTSIIDILDRFPMITDLDIDWEYPGLPGNTGNNFSADDTVYFQLLIGELRTMLDAEGYGHVTISIATNASVKGLRVADIPGMIASGVDGINLMTYDFFGTPWAPALTHHTNLYGDNTDDEKYSIESAVLFLKQQGVDLKKVFIGYAAYSRSAKNATISSFSPLEGTYNPGTGTTTGSFESGATEWYDIINNYLDLEGQQGKNGFTLYTDSVADADYLYNAGSKLFLSIDTPRTVKAKGEFVRKHGLGGLFTWTIDMDNGVLVNAAREGLGFEIQNQVVDMSGFYFDGNNSEAPSKPVATISGETELQVGESISLSARNSVNATQYLWSAPGLAFDGSTDANVQDTARTVGAFNVSLKVTDSEGETDTTAVTLSVVEEVIPQWEPKAYPQKDTLVRNNYQGQGSGTYKNNWYANPSDEPGNPAYTGGPNTGKVWSEVK